MHELSIAQNIVELVQQRVPENELERVILIRLKVGTVAGVVPESLEFSFQAITAESPLCSSRLEIESVPFRVKCHSCGVTTQNEIGFALCEECGSTDIEILSGSELLVSEIEIQDNERETS